jgi:hypothetical protein
MSRGGARNRSGPTADPTSGRSDQRGYSLTALPAEGFDGQVPTFPLPPRVNEVADEDFDSLAERIHQREIDMWEWAWTTPQACAWSLEPWRWPTVAMWVRTFVVCESSEATAADKGSLHRFADQIGMTPAGLKENGWAIARDEVGEKARSKSSEAPAKPKSSRDRMKVVKADGA